MGQVTVRINDRPYAVGCEDGQEQHVLELAEVFDGQVRQVAGQVGQLTEARLFLLASLLTADELTDTRARLAQAQSELARLQSEGALAERRAAQALTAAAARLEALAEG